jgi:hypothetical protein
MTDDVIAAISHWKSKKVNLAGLDENDYMTVTQEDGHPLAAGLLGRRYLHGYRNPSDAA